MVFLYSLNMSHWNSFNPDLVSTTTTQSEPPTKKRKTERAESLFGNELTAADDSTSIPDLGQTTAEQKEITCTAGRRGQLLQQKKLGLLERENLSHLRPYDFPLSALIQQAPRDTLSPEKLDTKRPSVQILRWSRENMRKSSFVNH